MVLEACYGWYWAADALAAAGAEVHLAHPAGVKAFSHRRVKNDLLTELAEAVSLVIGQVVIWLATVASHDHRRRSAAGLGPACGAGAANAF